MAAVVSQMVICAAVPSYLSVHGMKMNEGSFLYDASHMMYYTDVEITYQQLSNILCAFW